MLKQRRVAGVDTLILRDAGSGTFAVPVQWTDRATPGAYERLGSAPGRLDLDTLCELAELIELLDSRTRQGFAK